MNREEIAYYQQWPHLSKQDNNIETIGSFHYNDFKLKMVIRESHGAEIVCLKFNQCSLEYHNLLAAIGGNQATIYDDTYLGQYINVVLQFTNEPTTETNGGRLSCCAWVTHHETALPFLVVSGEDPNLSVISLATSSVSCLLKGHPHRLKLSSDLKNLIVIGHEETVVALESFQLKTSTYMVLSLDTFGEVRIWDVFQETCLHAANVFASCIMWSPFRGSFLYSTTKRIMEMEMEISKTGQSIYLECKESPFSFTRDLDGHIYNLLHLSDDCFAVQMTNGVVHIVKYNQSEIPLVPLQITPTIPNTVSHWVASQTGSNLLLGDTSGYVHIYETKTGALLGSLRPPNRLSYGVNACAISPNWMHILFSVGNGYLCRYQRMTAWT